MSDALIPARAAAAKGMKPFAGESGAYRAARETLLADEIELRRHVERVAKQRRALPPGPDVSEDYVFKGLNSAGESVDVHMSGLFRQGTNSLVVYCYMFPRHEADTRDAAKSGEIAKLPTEDQPCPSCTALLDQLDGAIPHFEAGGGNFVAVANTSLGNLQAVAGDRGWRNLRLLSSAGNGFKRAYHAEDPDGQQEPMTLSFKRDPNGTIRLFWASDLVWATSDPGQDHRASGPIEPFWNLFDFTPDGRPDFMEQLQYACCAQRPATPLPT